MNIKVQKKFLEFFFFKKLNIQEILIKTLSKTLEGPDDFSTFSCCTVQLAINI